MADTNSLATIVGAIKERFGIDVPYQPDSYAAVARAIRDIPASSGWTPPTGVVLDTTHGLSVTNAAGNNAKIAPNGGFEQYDSEFNTYNQFVADGEESELAMTAGSSTFTFEMKADGSGVTVDGTADVLAAWKSFLGIA